MLNYIISVIGQLAAIFLETPIHSKFLIVLITPCGRHQKLAVITLGLDDPGIISIKFRAIEFHFKRKAAFFYEASY